MIALNSVYNLFNLFHSKLFQQVLQVYSLIYWEKPSYNGEYPEWAHAIGWFIAATTVIAVPIFIVVEFLQSSGTAVQVQKQYLYFIIFYVYY